MPTPQFAWKAGLAALLLGVAFAVASLYLDDHRKLANLFFGLAVLGDVAFMVFAVLWAMGKAWTAEPAQPTQNARPPGMPVGLPPGVAAGKPPQPPQAQRPPQP